MTLAYATVRDDEGAWGRMAMCLATAAFLGALVILATSAGRQRRPSRAIGVPSRVSALAKAVRNERRIDEAP
jgi:hypothetical protein